MSYPYVVYTPPYDPRSGGIKVLHRLVHELNCKGYRAYCTSHPNPEWNEPAIDHVPEDAIVVYPEIVTGNPWGASVVARWVLNEAGRLAGETDYDCKEVIFPYKRVFNKWGLPEDRILLLPAIDLDVFYPRDVQRSGRAFYIGKGPASLVEATHGLPELRKEDTADQDRLATALSSLELLYTYDNITALWDCARLCGCPVVIIPNGEVTKEDLLNDELPIDGLGFGLEEEEFALNSVDPVAFRDSYLELFRIFDNVKLEKFIRVTQMRAAYEDLMRSKR